MNPVLFLDFDGVLNSERFFVRRGKNFTTTATRDDIDPDSVQILKWILEKTQAQLVISSSWRLMFDVDKVLDQFGLPKSVGKTPEINNATRGEEIQAWLNAHPECQRWLILDDEDDMLPEQFSAFFQTDPRVGLTKKVAERIVRFLEKPVNN